MLLGLEHLEIVGQALAIAIHRVPDRRGERPHRSILSGLGLAELAECGERIRDLAQRDQHRLLVLQPCLLPLRDGGAMCAKRAAGIEQRPAEHARDGPDRRAAARERRDLRARGAEKRGQAELGKELGFRDADPRVRAHEHFLGLTQVGPPLEQRRWQSRWHGGHHDLFVHRLSTRDRSGRLAEQNAELVFPGDDAALELRNGGLRLAEGALSAGGLEPRCHAEIEAIQEQVVGALVGIRAVPGDLQLHIEGEQLEVGLGQVADERQPDGAPRVLRGQQRGACGLVRATDAAPDVELPRHGHRRGVEVARVGHGPAGSAQDARADLAS